MGINTYLSSEESRAIDWAIDKCTPLANSIEREKYLKYLVNISNKLSKRQEQIFNWHAKHK